MKSHNALRDTVSGPFRAGRRGLAFAATLALASAASGAAPLELGQVLAAARPRSGALAAARLDAERAAAAVGEARARGLPQLSLTATGSWLSNPPEGMTVAAGTLGQLPAQLGGAKLPAEDLVFVDDAKPTYFKASLVLDQLLFSWGKAAKSVEAAEAGLDSARSSARKAGLDLEREASGAYFGAVLARDSLALLGKALGLLDEIVADKETAMAQGTATAQELLEARSRRAALAAQRTGAEEGLASALAALEFHSGLRPEPGELATPPRDALPDIDEAALAAALGSSPELESLRARARQAAIGEAIGRASLAGLPDFFLNATYDFKGQGPPFAAGWEDLYDYGLTVTIGGRASLFDSFSSARRLDQARAQRAAAEAGAAELARSSELRARRLVEAARKAAASLEAARAAAELARERARNASVALENELLTRAEERGARIAALAAELELAAARGGLESALLDIERALGEPLPRP